MKLNKNFIPHTSGGESLLAATANADFSGVVRGNRTAGMVFELLRSEITRDEIVTELGRQFNAPQEKIGQDVDRLLDALREIGALDE